MVYAVYEFNGRDDVWGGGRDVEDANKHLDWMHIVDKGGKPLGYMTDAGEIGLANIYPIVYGNDQDIIKADLFPRIARAVEIYKKQNQDG